MLKIIYEEMYKFYITTHRNIIRHDFEEILIRSNELKKFEKSCFLSSLKDMGPPLP